MVCCMMEKAASFAVMLADRVEYKMSVDWLCNRENSPDWPIP